MCYLLSFKGLLSASSETMKRETFENYPIYLKHTVFHTDEKMEKIRTLEIGHRFFIYDKFREKGNKEYNKGNFESALVFYQQVSCSSYCEGDVVSEVAGM